MAQPPLAGGTPKPPSPPATPAVAVPAPAGAPKTLVAPPPGAPKPASTPVAGASKPPPGVLAKPGATPAPPAVPKPGGPVSAVVAKAKAEQEILTQIERLPSLPTVILEVMRIANNPKSNASSFDEALKQDQMLTARVLKLVNSSFFARMRKVTTISESVVVLGFNTLKSVVTAAGASRVLGKKMEGYGYGEFGLWKHSFATALTSKIIATALKVERTVVEEIFIAGLLHDIGKLVLDPLIRERGSALTDEIATKKKPRIEAERSVLGFDHAEIGVKVAKKWNLPEQVEEAIAAHHAIENAREHGKTAAVVALADNLMNAAGVGLVGGKALEEPIPPMALDVLSIQSGDVEKLKEKVAPEMDNIRSMCDQLASS